MTRPVPARRALNVGVPFLVFAGALALAWFRLPAAARETMWAEDAKIFSARALDHSSLPWGIFTPYDGYVHAVPQSIALLIWSTTPAALVALAFTAAACATAAATAALIYVLTASWGLNVAGRLLMALTTVLVPGLSYEVLGNLANLHWFLLWLAPFVFLARPTSWWTSALLGLVSFAILSTEIQALLFLPLLLWRTNRKRWPIGAGALAAALIQVVAALQGGRTTTSAGRPRILSIVDGYALQVPLVGLSGSGEAASAQVAYSGWIAAFAALAPFVIAGCYWAWGSRTRAFASAGLFAASVIIWSAGYSLNRAANFDFSAADTATLLAGIPLLRYAVVPSMFLFALLALAVGRMQHPTRASVAAVVGAVILVSATFVAHYRVDVHTPRLDGPTWTSGLQTAIEACSARDVDSVNVRVAPLYGTWAVPLPCDRING